MKEHVELLVEQGLPVPPQNPDPVAGAGQKADRRRSG